MVQSFVRYLLLTGTFNSSYSKQTGDPCLSFPPWPAPQFPGGGAVIPCEYIIKLKQGGSATTVRSGISAAVKEMAERSVLQIKIIEM